MRDIITLDGRKRLLLKDARFSQYKVITQEDGTIILKPMVLVPPECVISDEAMRTIEESMSNLNNGLVNNTFNEEDWNDL